MIPDQATTRAAVYVLARTQNQWIPSKSTLHPPEGFADQHRFLTCPDCLANGQTMFGCETCGGRGEIPDTNPDPMRVKASGQQAFYGHDHQEARDRARAIDGQILRLRQTARERAGTDDPEDWLTRSIRLKAQQHTTGDYRLLEAAQQQLGLHDPGRYFLWMRCVVDGLPCSATGERILDLTADWIGNVMLTMIALQQVDQTIQARLLGARVRLRPPAILVPLEDVKAPDTAGKGRWANEHTQSQRNAVIVGMAAEGKTAGTIARQVGLTKRRVQQLLAQVELAAVATGPAA